MEKELISIIVPIYNTEAYLTKCIDSILNQSYQNLEIILVDDGSTDNSALISKQYAQKDSRIHFIHQNNSGVSIARNVALDYAHGDYIGFVDSDDYIAPDMFETLYTLSQKENADISMVSYYIVENNQLKKHTFTEQIYVYDAISALRELLIDQEVQNYTWNKLYKKSIFEKKRFPVGKFYEDIDIMYHLFEDCKKIVYRDTPKYYYVKRQNSIVNYRTYENCKDYFDVSVERYHYIQQKFPQLAAVNAYGFIANMIIVIKNYIYYDFAKLQLDFENVRPLFYELLTKYETEIYHLITPYRRVLLSLYLWDPDRCKNLIGLFMKEVD